MNSLRPFCLAAVASLVAATAAAQSTESPVAVEVVVYTEVVPTMPITGTVFSRNDSQITAAIDGELEFVAEPGTLVRAGEVIARIDPTPLRLQLAEFEAQGNRAKAQLAFLETQLERFESLLVSNSAARNEYDETRSNRDVAASDLAIAQSRVAQTRDQLARAAIRAQFGGVITARERRQGETVARGTVLGRITDTQQLEVRVLAPLQHSGRVRPGDELALFGYESTFVGVVRTVVPSVDARTQATELRIDLPAAAHEQWSLGQLVSAAVPLRTARASLAVNRDALILRQDGTYVYRVGEDGTAERVAVQTGESAGELVAVEGELAAGDRVVVRGGETLRDGQSVRVVQPAPAA